MSEWQVRVIKIDNIEKHPNADTLSITNVDGGYPCIFKTTDFKIGDLAVYIPIDSICPDTPQFDFLQRQRIKAKRLRGIFSMGLLIPAESGMKIGQIADQQLGIRKWEPEIEAIGKGKILTGEDEYDPGFLPVYTDIESMRKYKNVISSDDEVVLTEKIHGVNSRFVYSQNELWIGSHNKIKRPPWHYDNLPFLKKIRMYFANVIFFLQKNLHISMPVRISKFASKNRKRDIPPNLWCQIALKYNLKEKLSKYPDIAIYGEIYGKVQYLHYGKDNDVDLILFDAMDIKTGKYFDYDDFIKLAKELDIPTVPLLYRGKWDESLTELRNGKTTMPNANHIREGFVVKPVKEKQLDHFGRVCLKFVGEDYLLDKKNPS
jgi:RNA ligase (TIGR02306 family)